MCNYDEGEPASVYSETKRKARKEHRCEECRCTIVPGENYRYVFGVWEGEAESYKQCLDCQRVIEAWRKVSLEVCNQHPTFVFGGAGEALAEFVSEHLKMIQMLGTAVSP